MEIDEGMVVTVEELDMKFVVTDIVGDRAYDFDDRSCYTRIDRMIIIPFRERKDG